MVAVWHYSHVMAADLLSLEGALESVLGAVSPLGRETVALQSALGRVLDEDAVASEPVPAFANSAMDGFAVRSSDLSDASPAHPVSLRLVTESRAGAPSAQALHRGEAALISTGAALPGGADAVVRVEHAQQHNGQVVLRAAARRGEDVREAGEDVRSGQTVLRRGAVLGAAELGVLAALGRARIACARRPRVSVIVTGDELVAPGSPRGDGGVHDSNSVSLPALVSESAAVLGEVAIAPDDGAATRSAISMLAGAADALLICGGVSVGRHDHVRPALRELGAREHFWGVALKPGRPTWFGTLDGRPIFGLPGNPVSAMVSFLLLARPALERMGGLDHRRWRASALLAEELTKAPGRTHAVRCRLRCTESGLQVQPTIAAQGSHILTSMLGAQVLALLPRAATIIRAGERVEVERISP